MALADDSSANSLKRRRYWPQRRRWQAILVISVLILVALAIAWQSRNRIADNVIEAQLEQLGIEATYEIETIGPNKQVLTDLIIGDPARPDLEIERIEITPTIDWWGARLESVTLVRPRLRASYRGGKLSMGALDPLLERDTDQPFELPGWELKLIDARARLFTDYGVIGASADGSGALNDKFRGRLAVASPRIAIGNCQIANANLQGRVKMENGRPEFAGPFRLRALECGEAGLRLTSLAVSLNLIADRDLSGINGRTKIRGSAMSLADLHSTGVRGEADIAWREGLALARYSLTGLKVAHSHFSFAELAAEGALRLQPSDRRIEIDTELSGRELRLGFDAKTALARWRDAVTGTLAEPLAARAAASLETALPGSEFSAEVTFRQTGFGRPTALGQVRPTPGGGVVADGYSLVVHTARLIDRGGESLLALSQGQLTSRENEDMKLAGNFATGGDGLPQIVGRVEQTPGGLPALRLQMAPYSSGGSRLAVPELVLARGRDRALGIAGNITASGSFPGGKVEALQVPLSGSWTERLGLVMWPDCTQIGFGKLEMASLALDRNRLRVCPGGANAILHRSAGEIVFAAKTERLNLAGTLAENAARLSIGAVNINSSEGLAVSDAEFTLGPRDDQSRLSLREITAVFGDTTVGKATGIEGGLAAIPLEIMGGSTDWQYADGALALGNAEFELQDRTDGMREPRFYPVQTRDAALNFADNRITSSATLLHPGSGREIFELSLSHDLGTAVGFADLRMPGLRFDEDLQPAQITLFADGVIALAQGTISGQGRIDWSQDEVTSTGAFSSDDFDFAAAFGPVQNVSGAVRFKDLLSFTTDGTQSLKIGSINPGVEVFDGIFDFALRDGTNVSLRGGRWPFFGGTMELRPTELNLAKSEERRYIIEISGADAAQFVATLELGNISATGTFDGTVPLIFDEAGNGEIRNGLLISRPPGGNLSYVGELTYEDMGAMANFAFQSLRSLDFNQMMIEMNGPLTGEIITRLLFDGVRQGRGANSNLVTRQIAKLPIRFNVNIRAAFYELLTSMRGMYDPAFIRNPRDLGLLTVENGRIVAPSRPAQPEIKPDDSKADELIIQRQESEPMP